MEKERQVKLVQKAKLGDAHAFIQICENYQVVLYNAAYKILQNDADVADCLQETEIRAWKKIPQLKNEAAFNTWIFRIMINIAKAILKKRIETTEFEEAQHIHVTTVYEEQTLEDAFEHLPEKYKIPIVLHYYAGFNIQEIAIQLSIPKNTVKTRLARGRERLKVLLEGEKNESR